MTKTAAALAIAFSLGAGAAMGTRELFDLVPGTRTYYVHHMELDQSPAADGGYDVRAKYYVTGIVTLVDGGVNAVDLGSKGSCPLVKDEACARALLARGIDPACR